MIFRSKYTIIYKEQRKLAKRGAEMKFQKLGKNFSKFHIYGTELPYSEKEGTRRTCPNGVFIKPAMQPAPEFSKDPEFFSPYDLENTYNELLRDIPDEEDVHTVENLQQTIYYK